MKVKQEFTNVFSQEFMSFVFKEHFSSIIEEGEENAMNNFLCAIEFELGEDITRQQESWIIKNFDIKSHLKARKSITK